jgi:hypothetical protein
VSEDQATWLTASDKEGQTKWLGPSSGMPLLERLKPELASAPQSSFTMTEDWLNLSPSPAASAGGGNALWAKLLAICPEDLVDK